MRTAAPARETFTAAIAFESGRAVHLRLRAGDEGRQAIDAAGIGNHRLRLRLRRLILRLRTMLAMGIVFAGLMLTRLVGLALALMLARRVVARHERLRLCRDEAMMTTAIQDS